MRRRRLRIIMLVGVALTKRAVQAFDDFVLCPPVRVVILELPIVGIRLDERFVSFVVLAEPFLDEERSEAVVPVGAITHSLFHASLPLKSAIRVSMGLSASRMSVRAVSHSAHASGASGNRCASSRQSFTTVAISVQIRWRCRRPRKLGSVLSRG